MTNWQMHRAGRQETAFGWTAQPGDAAGLLDTCLDAWVLGVVREVDDTGRIVSIETRDEQRVVGAAVTAIVPHQAVDAERLLADVRAQSVGSFARFADAQAFVLSYLRPGWSRRPRRRRKAAS